MIDDRQANSSHQKKPCKAYYSHSDPSLADCEPLPLPAFMAQEIAREIFLRDAYFFSSEKAWVVFLGSPGVRAPRMTIDITLLSRMQTYLDSIA